MTVRAAIAVGNPFFAPGRDRIAKVPVPCKPTLDVRRDIVSENDPPGQETKVGCQSGFMPQDYTEPLFPPPRRTAEASHGTLLALVSMGISSHTFGELSHFVCVMILYLNTVEACLHPRKCPLFFERVDPMCISQKIPPEPFCPASFVKRCHDPNAFTAFFPRGKIPGIHKQCISLMLENLPEHRHIG